MTKRYGQVALLESSADQLLSLRSPAPITATTRPSMKKRPLWFTAS